jgi:HlyD family secretion protein
MIIERLPALRRALGRVTAARRERRTRLTVTSVVCMLGASVAMVRPQRSEPWPTAVVREGAFVETLIESGTVNAARLMLYGSSIAGGAAKIVELAPEGRSVSTGDLLIRFDDTAFQQELTKETAALRQAEADLRRAREEVRVESLDEHGELEQAREEIDHAENELADEIKGAGLVRLLESEAAATDAAREVERAHTAVEDLKPMLAEGFITRAELEKAEQAWQRAQEQKRLTDMKRDALQAYGRPVAVSRAQAEVKSARDGLARKQEAISARRIQRGAILGQAQARIDEIRARIALIEDRLSKVLVRADAPGLVVYRDLFFGSDRRKPQVGDEVFSNQPIIALPDSAQLIVDTRIREADLHKVTTSQQVYVRVDAYPQLRLRANVALIGALASADEGRAGTKSFPVTIKLLETDPRLRSGMTARVDIEVASVARATLVPVKAVFEQDGETFCFILKGGRPARQAVVVGNDNGVDVTIRQGVKAGDTVLVADPRSSQ